jgi:hypothetical protein
MMAGQQYFRHIAALPYRRPRKMRVFEQPPLEALLLKTCFRAQHSGQQPHAGVDQGNGRGLAAREHKISEADLLEPARLDHPLVHPFVASAQHANPRAGRQLPDQSLIQAAPARGQIDYSATGVGSAWIDHAPDHGINHVGTHYHAGAAAEWGVIDGAVFIARESPNVHCFQCPKAARQCLSGERVAKRSWKHLRKERQDASRPRPSAGIHPRFSSERTSTSSGGWITSFLAARSTTGTAAWENGTIKGRSLPPSISK